MRRILTCRLGLAFAMGLVAPAAWAQEGNRCTSENTTVAEVVALDMPMVFNRLGAQNVNWHLFALRHDLVVRSEGKPPRPALLADVQEAARNIKTGSRLTLRPDLRPRPLVLRMAAGECLRVNFTNLLTPVSNPFEAHKSPLLPAGHPMDHRSSDPSMDIDDQVASRVVGFHPNGLQLMDDIGSDSSHVGRNPSSLAGPGQSRSALYFAAAEGSFLVTNPGAAFGGEGTAGTSGTGLFGVVAVQPVKGRAYRAQVTEEELRLSTRKLSDPLLAGQAVKPCASDASRACTPAGQPIIHYDEVYPKVSPWVEENKAGLPILNMVQVRDGIRHLIHGDINAIVLGPEANGGFPKETYPLEARGITNPTLPNRLEPFREFVSVFHDENAAAQAFPGLFNHPVLGHTLHGVRDAFMINYGSGGVGAEVVANRLRVGPMHDCVDCAFEEFFLSSFTVGDPALLVDTPANLGLEQLTAGTLPGPDLVGVTAEGLAAYVKERGGKVGNIPLLGPKAKKTFYPHDPANVHHSYLGDAVKFRNLHAGKEQHIFHLHNHQWLFNPNDDNSNYIDAQAIGPGSGYTYEIAFGGSGNRNKSAGDAVFHCHYYPHFAQGMWYLWRIHDTFEAGTVLKVSGGRPGRPGIHKEPFALADGTPAASARALPDGEIAAGTPIPAIVPLPGKALALMPGEVNVVANPRTLADGRPIGSLAKVVDRKRNPGFPFWIAGIEDTVGSRPPTPPLDMDATVGGADGGVPRHVVEGYSAGSESEDTFTRLDATKHEKKAKPRYYPEKGTDIEQVAMEWHAFSKHDSHAVTPAGGVSAAAFVTNGAPATAGAPYFDPCVDDTRKRLDKGRTGQFFGADGNTSLLGASQFNAQTPRIYKGANIQLDVTINKLGDHYPQQRILALWEDVDATLATGFRTLPGAAKVKEPRPPEPLVLRMNTFDCARYLHTNLVPKEFEMDDYQVRTPTDIIGQHIHLPKWDLPSADGSANGWNYEDGTFSPGMVRSRIHAINAWNDAHPTQRVPNPYAGQSADAHLVPRAHYFFGQAGPFQAGNCEDLWTKEGYKAFHNGAGGRALPGQCDWLGARTTIQRWFSDPVVNKEHQHRGLGITFTHDHLGPSTHQQVGLYATMLTEPPESTWVHNETGVALYQRQDADCLVPGAERDRDTQGQRPQRRCDGGPTTWQAVIRSTDEKTHESHREFFLQFGDFQHAYRKGAFLGVNAEGMQVPKIDPVYTQSFRKAVTPSYRKPASGPFPDVIALEPRCPGDTPTFKVQRPCPEVISADDVGTLVVNYRQEPIAARVLDLSGASVHAPGMASAKQTAGRPGDLAFAYQSRTDRALPELKTVKGAAPYEPLTHDVRAGDPFTPILRAYSGDLVRIKIQAGSHEHEHNGGINGLKWLQAGSGFGQAPHSGWRGAQNIGLSEQFTLSTRITDVWSWDKVHSTDRLYTTDASQDGQWNGAWGVIRTLERRDPKEDKRPALVDDQDRLAILPANPLPTLLAPQDGKLRRNDCPADAPVRQYELVAGLANQMLPSAAQVRLPSVGGIDPKGGTLVYNPRNTRVTLNVFHEKDNPLTPALDERRVVKTTQEFGLGPLHDPTAILIVRKEDLAANGKLHAKASVEPVVLRAAAGECVQVTLENRLPVARRHMPDLAGYTTLSMLMPRRDSPPGQQHTSFNNNHVRTSSHIGLHPQMVQYDLQLHDATVVGGNSNSLVAPGQVGLYKWYAGELRASSATPVPADEQCLVGDGVGGAQLLNQLRAHARETPDGLRRLRPPNQLLTETVLFNRLQVLLGRPLPDDAEPAPSDADAQGSPPQRAEVRHLTLSAALRKQLQVSVPAAILGQLRVQAAAPDGMTDARFQAQLAAVWSQLLKLPSVQQCLAPTQQARPLPQALPTELREALSGLQMKVSARTLALDAAPTYAPETAWSVVEALDRQLDCAKTTREPVTVALKQIFDQLKITHVNAGAVAASLSSSMAYLVPGLDADALGDEGFDRAFTWLKDRPSTKLESGKTTRLVMPARKGDQCTFAGIEFGGSNLSPPDRIKQGQKAAVGALVIEPEKSLWFERSDDSALDRQNPGLPPVATRESRATAHVFYPARVQGKELADWRYFRDLAVVHQKGLNMRYGTRLAGLSSAVGSLAAEREDTLTPTAKIAPEDAHDAGQMAINYGSEPMWFRFGMEPSAPFGHGPNNSNPAPGVGFGGLAFAHQGFADACCGTNAQQPAQSAPLSPMKGPYTPIFSARPGAEARLRLLMPTGVGRASTMVLHGHGWQRDPYLAQNVEPVAVEMAQFRAPGERLKGGLHLAASTPVQYGVASKCQGRNALGMTLGAQDSIAPMAHFDLVLEHSGGSQRVPGDYLLRDIGGFGLTSGLWGLLRVEGAELPLRLRQGQRTACQ